MLRKHIPNCLTLSRIALCPFIVHAFFLGRIAETIVLLFTASITDYFDGYLSRKWRVTSALGAFLDPVCDKLYTIALFSSLMVLGVCPVWFLALLITVSLLQCAGVLLLKLPMSSTRPAIQPSRVGKAGTALQMIWIGILVVENLAVRSKLFPRFSDGGILFGFLVLALLQIYVFCHYAFRYRARLVPGFLQTSTDRTPTLS